MNQTSETLVIIFLIIISMVVAVMAGYSTGYYNGQRDAKNGHYRFGYETNITYTVTGEVVTNATWKANGK